MNKRSHERGQTLSLTLNFDPPMVQFLERMIDGNQYGSIEELLKVAIHQLMQKETAKTSSRSLKIHLNSEAPLDRFLPIDADPFSPIFSDAEDDRADPLNFKKIQSRMETQRIPKILQTR